MSRTRKALNCTKFGTLLIGTWVDLLFFFNFLSSFLARQWTHFEDLGYGFKLIYYSSTFCHQKLLDRGLLWSLSVGVVVLGIISSFATLNGFLVSRWRPMVSSLVGLFKSFPSTVLCLFTLTCFALHF